MPAIRVWQEIHCTRSGGGCGGFVLIKLNTALQNHRVEIVCPKCGHKHIRLIHNGVVLARGRFDAKTVEEIRPPLAAWSKEPRTFQMKERIGGLEERDGAVIEEVDLAKFIIRESWTERFLGKFY